jgi:S-adenosylmethionine:tRNA ribosyltransferase-isomerase
MNFDDLSIFDYELPDQLLALSPSATPSNCKLLNVECNPKLHNYSLSNFNFIDIVSLLPKDCLLVFNQTKVRPVSLDLEDVGMQKQILVTSIEDYCISFLVKGKIKQELINLRNSNITLSHFSRQSNGEYTAVSNISQGEFLEYCDKFGRVPLPPYLKKTKLSQVELKDKYQSIFARTGFSIAAPTASLHFDDKVKALLHQNRIELCMVRLDVGLGTRNSSSSFSVEVILIT